MTNKLNEEMLDVLELELTELYSQYKVFLFLRENWDESSIEHENLFNLFALIEKSLWSGIVHSINRLVLDKRTDVATLSWFLEIAKQKIKNKDYRLLSSKLKELMVNFSPFTDSRNNYYAHLSKSYVEDKQDVSIKYPISELTRLIDELWELYKTIRLKISDITSLSNPLGLFEIECLFYILKEYHTGKRKLKNILKILSGEFTGNYDDLADTLYINFKKPSYATDSEITDDDVIIRYENKEIIGFTVLNVSHR